MADPATLRTREQIPDRRRTRFPLNGGPKPTERQRYEARQGIAAAREALARVQSSGPAEPTVTRRLTAEQLVRARQGIARAREALETGPADDGPTEPESLAS